jgi:hypothetical protein
MEEEFALADFVVVPSTMARKSFETAGFAGKALVVHAWINEMFFNPGEMKPKNSIFRVCYVGRIELAKALRKSFG